MRNCSTPILLAMSMLCGSQLGCAEEEEGPAPSLTGSAGSSAQTTASGATASGQATTTDPTETGPETGSETGDGPNEPGVIPTCEDGEFKFVGVVDGQPVNAAPDITSQNYDGFGNSLRLDLSVGELRLGWDTTVEGPVDVTGHLDTDGVEGRICAGDGSFLDLDPMESLPFELRGLMLAADGDCASASPVSGEILGCWGAGW